MKLIIPMLLIFLTSSADALDRYDQSSNEVYKPNLLHDRAVVRIMIVEDADNECRRYGATFNFQMKNCTVWWDENDPVQCLLIMDKDYLTMGSLGHELRHCFEGDWHVKSPTGPELKKRKK